MSNLSILGGARIGLGAAYGLGARGVEAAYARGVRFFLWGAIPKNDFGAGLRTLALNHRETLQIAIQSYSRRGFALRAGVELARFRLKIDHIDWLCLANHSEPPSEEIIAAACNLRDRGLVKQLMISCHDRPNFAKLAKLPDFAAWMVRYNAAHRRAESEVFPLAASPPRAIVAYTALRWGTLLLPEYAPPGEPPLSAVEAYRFVLSNPEVDLCLCGPKDEAELAAALTAMEQGPLDEQGLLRARRVGDAAYAHGRAQPPPRMRDILREGPALVADLFRNGVTEHLLSRFNR